MLTQQWLKQLAQNGASSSDHVIKWNGVNWIASTLSPTNIINFDEGVQDAIGNNFIDTDTIQLVYDDITPTFSANAITQLSITSDASGIKLVNDTASPGNNKIYGTNSGGTKGWYDSPSGADGNGIYTGSGTIGANVADSTTTATMASGNSEFLVKWPNGQNVLRFDVQDGGYLFSIDGSALITWLNESAGMEATGTGFGSVNVSGDGTAGFFATSAINLETNSSGGTIVRNTSNLPNAKAILTVDSTTKAMLLPRFNSTQFTTYDSTATDNGMLLYNSTTHRMMLRANNTWVNLGSGLEGGIYGGSGTIAPNVVASMTAANTFTITDSGGDWLFRVDDGNKRTTLASDAFAQQFIVDTTGARLDSITKMLRPPRMTTDQRIGGTLTEAGGLVYDTTLNKMYYRDNAGFVEIGNGAAGNGGIYGGSGNVPSGTVATLVTGGNLTFDYFGGTDAIKIDDTAASVQLQSKNGTFDAFVTNTGIVLSGATNDTLLEVLASEVRAAYDDGGSAPQQLVVDSTGIRHDSTTKMFRPPRMTTTQRNNIVAPEEGGLLYNTSTQRVTYRNASAFVELLPDSPGNGGIYGGSGTIAQDCIAQIANTGTKSFQIRYPASLASGVYVGEDSVELSSTGGDSTFRIDDNGVFMAGDNGSTELLMDSDRISFRLNSGRGVRLSATHGTPDAKSILELLSTERGFLLPRMNSTQFTTYSSTGTTNGMLLYNTTTHTLKLQSNGSWVDLVDGEGTVGIPLSSIKAATAINGLENTSFSQQWNWGGVTTGPAFDISANALTTGSVMRLFSNSGSLNSTRGLLDVHNQSAVTNGLLASLQSNSSGGGLYVTTNSRVGINKTDPDRALDVSGGIRASAALVSWANSDNFSSSDSVAAVKLANTSASRTWYMGHRDDGHLRIGDDDNPYVDITPATGLFQHFAAVAAPAVHTSSSLGANQNNYNIGATAFGVRLQSSTPINITGFTNGSQGRILFVCNIGANNITLMNENAGSDAANRFASAADVTLAANRNAVLWYDNDSSRWRIISIT